MSKRLKVTANDTNPSLVYDVVATIRQYPNRDYGEIARILDEPYLDTYKAMRYAEAPGYIHGYGGYYVRHGAGGRRLWLFDRLAPYPYEYMDGKRHAYKVERAVLQINDLFSYYPTRYIYQVIGLFDSVEDAERWIRRDKKRLNGQKVVYYHRRVTIPSGLMCPRLGA